MKSTSSVVNIQKDDLGFIINLLTKVYEGQQISDGEASRLKEISADKPTTPKASTDSAIRTVLNQLGVRPGILGYGYLQTAIKLVLEDPSLIQSITKGLYPAIAKIHNTTSSRAERAIRHAVEVAFNNYGNEEIQMTVFGYSVDSNKGKPTNTHFIAAVVEYLNTN